MCSAGKRRREKRKMREENREVKTSLVFSDFQDGDEKVLSALEAFALDAGVNEKGAQRFRLLAEELISMTGVLLDPAEESLWAEDSGELSLHYMAKAPVGKTVRTILISSSSSGKNQAYHGMTGRIRDVLDRIGASMERTPIQMASSEQMAASPLSMSPGFFYSSQGDPQWSSRRFMEELDQEDRAEAWDRLELSLLTRLSSDLEVAVTSSSVRITVKASLFPEG